MSRNAGLIEELERRARSATTVAEGLRLQQEADRLRLGQGTTETPSEQFQSSLPHG